MPRRRSQTTAEMEAKILETLDEIQKDKFKSTYYATKILNLNTKILRKHKMNDNLFCELRNFWIGFNYIYYIPYMF